MSQLDWNSFQYKLDFNFRLLKKRCETKKLILSVKYKVKFCNLFFVYYCLCLMLKTQILNDRKTNFFSSSSAGKEVQVWFGGEKNFSFLPRAHFMKLVARLFYVYIVLSVANLTTYLIKKFTHRRHSKYVCNLCYFFLIFFCFHRYKILIITVLDASDDSLCTLVSDAPYSMNPNEGTHLQHTLFLSFLGNGMISVLLKEAKVKRWWYDEGLKRGRD